MLNSVFKILGNNMKLSLEDFMEETKKKKLYTKVYLANGTNYTNLIKELDKIEYLITRVELDDENDMVVLNNGVKVAITEVSWDLISLKKAVKYLQKLSQLNPKNKLQVLSYIDIRRLKNYDNTFENVTLTLDHNKMYVAKRNLVITGNYRFYKVMKRILDLNLKLQGFVYINVKAKEFEPEKLKELELVKDYASVLINKKGVIIKKYDEDQNL